MGESEESMVKIIFSGLDNAGKTSILTALEKKYNFEDYIAKLRPTIKVDYKKTIFMGRIVNFWDMGGQQKYREQYKSRAEFYFSDTDLFIYLIDIQDEEKLPTSIEYLNDVLDFFAESQMDVPIIITFHKFDPDLRNDEVILDRIESLKEQITKKLPDFKILFQQTSIYDIISIVQLVSYGLSIFDERFFDLSELMEKYIDILKSLSLILFDQNGIIISEFYSEEINQDLYIELLEDIREHIFILKRMEEEHTLVNDLTDMEGKIMWFLDRIQIKNENFFLSALINKDKRELLEDNFGNLREEVVNILTEMF